MWTLARSCGSFVTQSTKYFGFEKKQWKELQSKTFCDLWFEGGHVYFIGPKSILAYVPGYTDPDRKVRVRTALEESWKSVNADPRVFLLVTELVYLKRKGHDPEGDSKSLEKDWNEGKAGGIPGVWG